MTTEHKQLDLLEDVSHQEVEWKIERVGWLFMTALVIGNLLGFFGHGLFNEGRVGAADAALQVEYQKRERYKAVSSVILRIDPALAGTSPRVTVGHEFASKVRISEVVPDPASVEAGGDFLVYQFNIMPGAPAEIRIFYEPFNSGFVTTRIGLEDSLEYTFRQFYFP